MLWAAAQPGALLLFQLRILACLEMALCGWAACAAARCTQLYSLPPLHSAVVHRRQRAFTRSTLLQQRRRAAAMPRRVQAKRRLRTTATLTLWAAVQPGAFSDCALRLLACLNWRLALLIGTLALARLVWRMRNQLSDKPAAQRTMSEYQQTFHMLSTEEDWSVDQPFTIQSTRLCCCGV